MRADTALLRACVLLLLTWCWLVTPLTQAQEQLRPQDALFLFQRCAGLYYALYQYAEAVEGETGTELRQQLLDDAQAAETAALHFRARVHALRNPGVDYDGEQFAQWRTGVHENALTVANQTYRILSRSGMAVIAQDLVPCNELHPLQNAIVKGEVDR